MVMSAWLAAAFLVPVALACAYYYVLLAVAVLLPPRRTRVSTAEETTHFTVVIPAHNEQETLAVSLASCARLRYPDRLRRVVVVADNCNDHTPRVARAAGAECLERTDPLRRGKGYALQWALRRLSDDATDAFLILDADCEIDRDALTAFDRRIVSGQWVLQADNRTSNPDDSAISYTMAVGNRMENRLFYAPKSTLGLSVFLRGTGMVLSRDVLRRIPWDATGLAEDVEHTMRLLEAGVRVHFVPEAAVRSRFPTDRLQMNIQRSRWARGNLKIARARGLQWMLRGIARRNARMIDAGFTLMVISKPFILLTAATSAAFSGLAYVLDPSRTTQTLVFVSIACAASLALYAIVGVLSLGITQRRVLLLVEAPLVIGRLAWIAVAGLLGTRNAVWTKTPRR